MLPLLPHLQPTIDDILFARALLYLQTQDIVNFELRVRHLKDSVVTEWRHGGQNGVRAAHTVAYVADRNQRE